MRIASCILPLLMGAAALAQTPATQPLTRTVGVDIVQLTRHADGTATALFRWKDKQNQDVERSVLLTPQTVIGIGGQLKTLDDLTDHVIRRNKAVATVGPDMTTAVMLRVGRQMIKVTREQLTPGQIAALEAVAPKATAASDAALQKRVDEMVTALSLKDPAKESRVKEIIATHLKHVRDTHNAGIAPEKSSRINFNTGLAAELAPEQIELVKDRITVNKVPVTRNAYHQIVPNLTGEEDAKIVEFLKAAREESLDVKNPDEMARVFEPYKTQIEQYLIANGRDWKKLYGDFTRRARATTQPPN